jgi:Raf kinase inhibitor-like YbhB/YbcL family protein
MRLSPCCLAWGCGWIVLAGCQSQAGAPNHETRLDAQPAAAAPAAVKGVKLMKIELTSSAFQEGAKIPKKFSGEGQDLSPPLAWSGLPGGTRELALICDDPDAPSPEPWVHWVIYKIPPTATALPEGLPKTPTLKEPPGALQGKNSWTSGQTIGYRGPLPPPKSGPHRYFFKLYALDAALNLAPEATKAALWKAISGHVLAEGRLIGAYER